MSKDVREEIAEKLEEDKERLVILLEEPVKEAHDKIVSQVEGMMTNIYTDYLPWIAVDMYSNLFVKYNRWLIGNFAQVGEIIGETTAKELRQRIYQENKDELIKQLDQDNLDRIKRLEERNNSLQEQLSNRY